MGTRFRKLGQVVCRAESHADQIPIKYRMGDANGWVDITKIHASWLQRGPGEKDPVYRVFEIESDQGVQQIRVEIDAWVWEIRQEP